MKWSTPILSSLIVLAAQTLPAVAEPAVDEVVQRYLEARGGAEKWRAVRSLWSTGVYSTFSDHERYEMARRVGDIYRLDFKVLDGEAVRARDSEGPWWRHPLLQPEVARLEEGPYKALVERESYFGPLLLDAASKGISVKLAGPAEIEGIAVLELVVGLPGGAEERWFLDAETFLEVAIDSQVNDYTQSAEPMRQRAFFDDFRDVSGLVIPFKVDYEFGHRLESMTIEEIELNRELSDEHFSPPPAEPAGE